MGESPALCFLRWKPLFLKSKSWKFVNWRTTSLTQQDLVGSQLEWWPDWFGDLERVIFLIRIPSGGWRAQGWDPEGLNFISGSVTLTLWTLRSPLPSLDLSCPSAWISSWAAWVPRPLPCLMFQRFKTLKYSSVANEESQQQAKILKATFSQGSRLKYVLVNFSPELTFSVHPK